MDFFRRHRKITAVIAIVTAILFTDFSIKAKTAEATGWVIWPATVASSGIGAYMTGAMPATFAAGLSSPAFWNPYTIGAGVTVAAVAGLYYLYNTQTAANKKVANDGTVNLPGGAVEWVDLKSGVPMLERATGGNPNVPASTLENAVNAEYNAGSGKYPNLQNALLKPDSHNLAYSDSVGSKGNLLGGYWSVYSAQNFGCGAKTDAGTSLWYDQGAKVALVFGEIGSGNCGAYPGAKKFWVQGATPGKTPIPTTDVQGALITDSCGQLHTCTQAMDMAASLSGELDQLIKDEPNVVHFDSPPSSAVAASDADIAAANAKIADVSSNPSVSGSQNVVSAATDALYAAQAAYDAAVARQNSACASGGGTADCVSATDAVNKAQLDLSNARTTLADAVSNADSSLEQAVNGSSSGSGGTSGDGTSKDYTGVLGSILNALNWFQTKRASDDSAISGTAMPSHNGFGNYSGSVVAPEKHDLKNAVSSFMAKAPFVGILNSLQIANTDANSVVSFNFHGTTISADMGRWSSQLSAAGAALLGLCHLAGVFIVFRKEG